MSNQIRATTGCVVRDNRRIFLSEARDTCSGELFYRPVGGGIEFGEHARQAVQREFREELDVRLTDLSFRAVIENIFTFEGEPRHEIVMLFEGNFADPALYTREFLPRVDKRGRRAVWVPLAKFARGELPLYPNGLIEVLRENKAHHATRPG